MKGQELTGSQISIAEFRSNYASAAADDMLLNFYAGLKALAALKSAAPPQVHGTGTTPGQIDRADRAA